MVHLWARHSLALALCYMKYYVTFINLHFTSSLSFSNSLTLESLYWNHVLCWCENKQLTAPPFISESQNNLPYSGRRNNDPSPEGVSPPPADAFNQDLDQFIVKSSVADATGRKYSCGICGKVSHKSRSNIRNHIESRHFPGRFQYACEHCPKMVNTKTALFVHKSAYHAKMNL